MVHKRSSRLPLNLAQLQNLMKRDAGSYRYEFDQQYRHFESQLELFALRPGSAARSLCELVGFLSQVVNLYPPRDAQLPTRLADVLRRHGPILHADTRLAICSALMLLCRKSLIAPGLLYELFFQMFRLPDKLLRKTLYTFLVTDIRRLNAHQRNAEQNANLQTFVFRQVRSGGAVAAKMAVELLKELYRRRIWNDAKTVNVIAEACCSRQTKLMVAALQFFLSPKKRAADDDDASDSDLELPAAENKAAENSKHPKRSVRQLLLAQRVSKKTRKKQRQIDRAMQMIRRQKNSHKSTISAECNFSAIHLLYDPHEFAEKLYRQLDGSSERFEVKLMLFNLLSRLIGVHQLMVLNFYPLVQRYLRPQQAEVTRLLTYAAQACHELVPPDVVHPMLVAVANNFITEHNANDVIAIGLNAIREMSQRCPLAVGEDLLHDLVQYKNFRDKSVSLAARSLVQLFRRVCPTLLNRKDRGRPTGAPVAGHTELSLVYGAPKTNLFVPGTELLVDELRSKQKRKQQVSDSKNDSIEPNGDQDSNDLTDESEDNEEDKNNDEDENDDEDDQENADDVSDSDNDGDDDCLDDASTDDASTDDTSADDAVDDSDHEAGESVSNVANATASSADVAASNERRDVGAEALALSGERFLTQKDLLRMRTKAIQLQTGITDAKPSKNSTKKRKNNREQSKQSKKRLRKCEKADDDNKNTDNEEDDAEAEEEEEEEEEESDSSDGARGELVKVADIERVGGRRRRDRAARLASVLAGREGRDKFGRRRGRLNPAASTSNRQKLKSKPFSMVRGKIVRAKNRRSFRDKQIALRNALLKRARRAK